MHNSNWNHILCLQVLKLLEISLANYIDTWTEGNFGRTYIKIRYSIKILFQWIHCRKLKWSSLRPLPPWYFIFGMGWTFSLTYWNWKCHSSFDFIFTEDIGGPFTTIEKVNQDDGLFSAFWLATTEKNVVEVALQKNL
jgi:hypothetical protein